MVQDWVHLFVRFALVGLTNVTLDFTVYLSLTRLFTWWQVHFLLANAVAFAVANTNSFLWNRHWTFSAREGSARRQYINFLITSLVYLGVIQGGMWSLVKVVGWPDIQAKLVVVAVAAAGYFIFLKLVVFRAPRHTPDLKLN